MLRTPSLTCSAFRFFLTLWGKTGGSDKKVISWTLSCAVKPKEAFVVFGFIYPVDHGCVPNVVILKNESSPVI